MEKFRKSSYLIPVKLEEVENKYLFIHGYTGAVDIVRGKVLDFLDNVEEFSKDDFPFFNETFESFRKRGYITLKTEEEEYSYFKKIASVLHEIRKNSFKCFTILVTYNCNYRCPYCYEASISKGGRAWSKNVFVPEMVDKAYKAMLQIEPNRSLHRNMIELYGGEPLLFENKEIVEYIVMQGVKKGYTFKAVTNGYDLNHFIDLLSPSYISDLQITIDGDRDKHDRRRIHYQTGKSFDRIIENIGLALEKGVRIVVRVNTDANNFEDLKKLQILFKSLGYLDKSNFKFQSALLVDFKALEDQKKIAELKMNNPEAINYFDSYQFIIKHKSVNYKFDYQDYGAYKNLRYSLSQNVPLQLNPIYCNAQSSGYILDPLGDIYACWDTVGKKDYILGNYRNDIEWTNVREQWQNRYVGNSPNCQKCKYGLLCGGGCLGKAKKDEEGFRDSFCNNYPQIFDLMANRVYKEFL